MKNYEKFKTAVMVSKEKNYCELQKEIKVVESAIEKFLQKALECTASISEKDFYISPM